MVKRYLFMGVLLSGGCASADELNDELVKEAIEPDLSQEACTSLDDNVGGFMVLKATASDPYMLIPRRSPSREYSAPHTIRPHEWLQELGYLGPAETRQSGPFSSRRFPVTAEGLKIFKVLPTGYGDRDIEVCAPDVEVTNVVSFTMPGEGTEKRSTATVEWKVVGSGGLDSEFFEWAQIPRTGMATREISLTNNGWAVVQRDSGQ